MLSHIPSVDWSLVLSREGEVSIILGSSYILRLPSETLAFLQSEPTIFAFIGVVFSLEAPLFEGHVYDAIIQLLLTLILIIKYSYLPVHEGLLVLQVDVLDADPLNSLTCWR